MTAVPVDLLRAELREARRALDEASGRAASAALAAHLVGLPELRSPGRLATYLAADGELDPNHPLPELRSAGWSVHLPVVGEDRSMVFAEWSADAELVRNRFGIPEPTPDHRTCGAAELDVVIVPCVAADPQGNRLGMGAGFYDRALANGADDRRPTLIGVVHDHAVVDALSPQPWDVPLDLVITDRRVIRP